MGWPTEATRSDGVSALRKRLDPCSGGKIVRASERKWSLPSAADVLAYWRALGPERWFTADAAVDVEIRARFHELY
jgi:hypothetical protein